MHIRIVCARTPSIGAPLGGPFGDMPGVTLHDVSLDSFGGCTLNLAHRLFEACAATVRSIAARLSRLQLHPRILLGGVLRAHATLAGLLAEFCSLGFVLKDKCPLTCNPLFASHRVFKKSQF